MDDRLEFSFVMQEKDYAHFLAMKDQWKAWKSGRRCLHPDERYLRQILASPELKKHLGQWSLIFGEEEICVRQGETGYRFFWKGIGGIVEFPDAFWFYGKEESGLFVIPKGVFPLEDRGAFMHWCRSKEIFCTPYTGGKARKQMPFLLQLFLLFLVFVGLLGLGAGEMLLANRAIKYVQESTSKVDTEDLQKQYPDYLTIEDQIAILRELGFEIPDGAADYYHSWMDDSESGRGYVEGHPFYVLLSDMGQAKYDLDTRMLIGNPDQVFWFPDVSWDISSEYYEWNQFHYEGKYIYQCLGRLFRSEFQSGNRCDSDYFLVWRAAVFLSCSVGCRRKGGPESASFSESGAARERLYGKAAVPVSGSGWRRTSVLERCGVDTGIPGEDRT